MHGDLPSDAHDFPSESPWDKAGQHAWAKFLQDYPATAEDNAEPVLRNRAFFIDAKGEVLGGYTKRNLWHPERCAATRRQLMAGNTLRQGKRTTRCLIHRGARPVS